MLQAARNLQQSDEGREQARKLRLQPDINVTLRQIIRAARMGI